MKIMTLNIRHGGGKRIQQITHYLESQEPDTVVLTEYRNNSNANNLRRFFSAAGYNQQATSYIDNKQNGVLIASKRQFKEIHHPSLEENNQRRLVTAEYDSFSLYGTYFPQKNEKKRLFDFFTNQEHQSDLPLLVIGDFNTGLHYQDEEGETFYCTKEFASLSGAGLIDAWRARNPDQREYSWLSHAGNGFRIDHVFTSFDDRVNDAYYDHTPRTSGITDHSALIVEVDME